MFTESALNLISVVLAKTFELYSVTFPGTHLSIMGLFLSVLASYFVISLSKQLITFGVQFSGKKMSTASKIYRKRGHKDA